MYIFDNLLKKKINLKYTSIIFGIFLCLSIFCFCYYLFLHSIMHKDCSDYLEETASQIENNIKNRINDYYGLLYLISNIISTQDDGTIKDLQTIVDFNSNDLDFQHFLLIDSDYVGYRNNGQSISLSENSDFQDAIRNKEHTMSTQHIIDNQRVIILAVPIEHIIVNGKKIEALAVSIDAQAFGQMVSLSQSKSEGYFYILNKNDYSLISAATNGIHSDDMLLNKIQGNLEKEQHIISAFKTEDANNQKEEFKLDLDGMEVIVVSKSLDELDVKILLATPSSAIHEKSNTLLNMMLLPFCVILLIMTILASILMIVYRRHRLKLENIAYVDPITEGNTLQGFYNLAFETLTSYNHKQYALVYSNIKNFKVLNEQLGHRHCDRILKVLYDSILANLTRKEIVGRVTADHFCVLLEYENAQTLLNRFEVWYAYTKFNMEKLKYSQWVHPEMEFGIYVIDNHTLPFQQLITRAKLALREVTPIHETKIQYAFYDDKLRYRLLREKQIEDMMEDALENGEFQVFLQPKYSLPDEQMVGAEALTRWHSKTEGMIYPDEFIPLFEKNGFVIQLDLWVFEEVCKIIRGWLDAGTQSVKVSINCSRVHFKKKDFFKEYVTIANAYNIPPNLLELELTESLVSEDMQQFIQVIHEIREAGFGCSVDDFGSGYSSLSIIENFPVDTLKLDKTFFRHSLKNRQRTEAVISSIIGMAHSLSMKIVAEGVEEREQVELLKRLGCHFIQGYVFAKPMPVNVFERFLK